MMRKILAILTTLLTMAACTPGSASSPAEPAVWRLYFLGGQSNMDGHGYNHELPRKYRKEIDDVMIYRGLSAGDGSTDGGVGIWQALGPGFGEGHRADGDASEMSNRFGPELTFGHRIAELYPAERIAIIKYARGGTSLYLHGKGYGTWSPDTDEANQYDFALRAIREALEVQDIDGDGNPDQLVPAGIVWMQGEQDANENAEAATAYEDNLRRMMDLLRTALSAENLPVAIGQITDSGKADDGTVMDWGDNVRAAQERYADSDACAVLVTATNELTYPTNDKWHYDSKSYVQLGIAFADAVASLDENCPP